MTRTSDRSFTLLVNPRAGGGAAPGAVTPLADALRSAGARVAVVACPVPEATVDLVAAAVAADDVVVGVGGDGMVSSLVGPVSEAGGVLGLLPAGRGNDFARMLGVPAGPASAEVLLTAAERRVDLLAARVGGVERTVAGSVYCGTDARAAALVDRLHRVPRMLQYPLASAWAITTYSAAEMVVEMDGERAEYEAAMVVVANSGYYGKGMLIAPGATVDDGALDVVVVEAASRVELLRRFRRLYDGSHIELPQVSLRRGTSVRVSSTGGAVPVGADGEPYGALGAAAAEITVRPGALRVLAP